MTQEQFSEKTGLTVNYISSIERGASFPRYDKLVILLNGLKVSADAVFCDALDYCADYKASVLSDELKTLPIEAQNRILQLVALMIEQEKENYAEHR